MTRHTPAEARLTACLDLRRPEGATATVAQRDLAAVLDALDCLRESYADHVLEVMARRGFDVRDRLLWREIRTPADLERDVRAPGGSIYGTSSNGTRAAFLRPANISPVPGLYLVGGSSHPGGGLPLVTMSARIVADMVQDDHR